MGGGYYEREVETASTSAGYSAAADVVFQGKTSMDPQLCPKGRALTCATEDAIVVAIDVTGSMGMFPRIMFDKLPMFYGQIMMQGYLKNPSISFAAIGDVDCDRAPLQVTEFSQGAAIDDQIGRIWVEGGGGDAPESYEYAAYYYNRTKFTNLTDKAFFFITGDEVCKHVTPEKAHKFLGDDIKQAPTNKEIFKELRKRFHVFFLCKCGGEIPRKVLDCWAPLVGEEHILPLVDPKACVDTMLGAIAVASQSRTIDAYVKDMRDRGQSEERVAEVTRTLERVAAAAAAAQK
eukprot:TRINITY_DN12692_c0_g1_i1.p1 TRINITY_DN12692_c0_g1~~TRINITY_DN12692_c0_g1_i1.p1  ORF type:complete len:309 (+),score=82.57 TRINITY_DN12692_c0_g1_i1:56-928(+)